MQMNENNNYNNYINKKSVIHEKLNISIQKMTIIQEK